MPSVAERPTSMKAVMLEGITSASNVELREVPVPTAKPGWALVRVHGFGMNHSEQMLREGEIEQPYIKKPVIPGIECVGEVVDPSDSELMAGQRVCALMGGMGREFDGSYAEYVLLPTKRLFKLDSGLPWDRLAAIPETWFTAWGSLTQGLQLWRDDVLLVRGATCALGHAAIQIAHAMGCHIIGTGRTPAKLDTLRELGCNELVVDTGEIAETVAALDGPAPTKVLELVGPTSLKDSMRCLIDGGIVCCTGILGGIGTLEGFDPIFDIPNGVSLTGFYSNFPTRTDIDSIFAFIEEHHIIPRYGACYDFEQVQQACIDNDAHKVDGKIVVVMR